MPKKDEQKGIVLDQESAEDGLEGATRRFGKGIRRFRFCQNRSYTLNRSGECWSHIATDAWNLSY